MKKILTFMLLAALTATALGQQPNPRLTQLEEYFQKKDFEVDQQQTNGQDGSIIHTTFAYTTKQLQYVEEALDTIRTVFSRLGKEASESYGIEARHILSRYASRNGVRVSERIILLGFSLLFWRLVVFDIGSFTRISPPDRIASPRGFECIIFTLECQRVFDGVYAILVETAYMINPFDYEKLLDKNFRQQTAKAIVDGIKKHLSDENK